jgi:hypothetical protein
MLKWEYDLSGSEYGAEVASCENSNKSSGSITGGEFLNYLRDY